MSNLNNQNQEEENYSKDFENKDDFKDLLENLEIKNIDIKTSNELVSNGIENLTGKIFDYISRSKPIIASCYRKSDILGILNYTTCGMLVSSLNDFELFLKKVRANYFYSKINNINDFSTKEQSDKLVQLLKLL